MLPFRLFWPNRYPLVTIFRIFHLARCEDPAPSLPEGSAMLLTVYIGASNGCQIQAYKHIE